MFTKTFSFNKKNFSKGEIGIKYIIEINENQTFKLYKDPDFNTFVSFELFQDKPGEYYVKINKISIYNKRTIDRVIETTWL